jgi:signal transduction histidine kinase
LAEGIQPLARRSLKLADDFLQLARAEAMDPTGFNDTDFVAVLHNAMGEIYAQAQQRGIRLQTRLDVEEAWLPGNVALLERALLNLLGNAVRFSPPGGVVGIHLQRDGAGLVCCVRDQGPGVPEPLREAIFQPYRQGKQQGREGRGGVGLGLSFVKIVAEKHHGRVELRDSDSGACFCLLLPCEADAL